MAEINGQSQHPPLVVICGPTASGKTGLAIRLAREFDGEIISADSRAIYRGLDIGTAKPTVVEQQQVLHWGIDLVKPSERFTAAEFQAYATAKIAEIRDRGRLPFLVGGTGLYVDSVVYDFQFPQIENEAERREVFEKWSLDELCEYCTRHNITPPENHKNKRYVINTILRNGITPQRRAAPISNTIIVGIATDKQELRRRIEQRAEEIFNTNVVSEARAAGTVYGWDNEAMTGNIYPLIRNYLDGTLTIEEAQRQFVTLDWRLAKRQLTWLKRSEHIKWLPLEEAYTYCARELAKLNNP